MTRVLVGLIGDHDPRVTAHRAIPRALADAARVSHIDLDATWLPTATISADPAHSVGRFDGLWCVPASPYASTEGALAAIRFARLSGRPFLGTCGGFQYAVLEFARNELGMDAAHAELDPEAANPVIAPLSCALVEQRGAIRLLPGSRLATLYAADQIEEEYHCRFGLAAGLEPHLAAAGFQVAARDPEGEVRALELDGHPFFVCTLFQPERAALRGARAPVVEGFVAAALSRPP